MAGENVIASGAIAVDINVHGFEEGAIPNAPGTAGAPKAAGGRAYTGFLSPEQRENLKLLREQARNWKELEDYNELVKKELPSQKRASSALIKFLPLLGGAFGIAELVRQSGIIKGYIGAVFGLLGAVMDLALLPLTPLLNKIIEGFSYIISGFAVVMTDPLRALKNIENFLRAIKEFFFGPPRLENQHTKDVLGDKYTPFIPDNRLDYLLDTFKFNLPFAKTLSSSNPVANIVNNIFIPAGEYLMSAEQIKTAAREGTKKAFENANWDRSGS